jgi:hypothetical protein
MRPDEQSVPPPAAPPALTPRAQAMRNVKDAKELTGDVVSGDGPYGDLGGRTLSNLLKIHVFMSFFCWLADRQNPAGHRPETRVARLREDSPTFYWICVTLDMVVGVIAVAILVLAAAAILYKTIWLTGGSAPPLP